MTDRPARTPEPGGTPAGTVEPSVRVRSFFEGLQERICSSLEEIDHGFRFGREAWTRPEGGGGLTRVLEDGAIFEKAGVNTSTVSGVLPEETARRMNVPPVSFHATGISLVIHPRSPMVPAVHANFRYFELGNGDWWFGGGTDLTPFYPFAEDIVHFHKTLKYACDLHGPEYYPRFKQQCDEYFYNRHRQEARGIGGLFFDYLRGEREETLALVCSIGEVFLETYTPIVNRRIHEPYGERERMWQAVRRSRYAEFNLLYDRGTRFGLETNGRVESVLVSLPPVAFWRYDFQPVPGSPEARLIDLLTHPRAWV